jgi:hypothetical protein
LGTGFAVSTVELEEEQIRSYIGISLMLRGTDEDGEF